MGNWEATYRVKRDEGHRGYVANLTETCDLENEVQLITRVQVAPNITDDEQFVVEGLPDLKARTDPQRSVFWRTPSWRLARILVY